MARAFPRSFASCFSGTSVSSSRSRTSRHFDDRSTIRAPVFSHAATISGGSGCGRAGPGGTTGASFLGGTTGATFFGGSAGASFFGGALASSSAGGAARFAMEALVLALALAIAAMLAYALGDLAHDSWLFDDVAQGTVPWKLWIPQGMAAGGAALLAVSLLDDLVVHLAGGVPSYRRAAEASALERAGEEI